MRRAELPPSLGAAFSTHAALDAGVTASRLRAHDLRSPFRGVRTIRPVDDPRSPEERILDDVEAYRHRMTSHEFFTHVTAAVLWELPVPAWLTSGRQIDAGVFAPRRNQAGGGVIGHSVKPGHAHVVIHPTRGVPGTSPASTWALLGGLLPHPFDVVALADAVVRVPLHRHDRPALADLGALEAAVAAGRRPGIRTLREALPRVSTRASSRPESWMRLELGDAGLPEPEVNFDVHEAERWIARVDLAYPRQRVAVEYEVQHHMRDAAQWEADIARVERLVEAGWRVIRVTRADVFEHPITLTSRVRRALADAGS